MTRGEAMRAARERKGMSVRGLAKIADISYMTIYRLESDEIGGALASVVRLADALGLSIDEYIGHEVEPYDGA